MRISTLIAALVLIGSPATARQSSQVLVDLGTDGFPTNGTVAQTWNDVDSTNMAVPFELVDTLGAGTGIQWELTGSLFTGANSAGTAAPQPGSPLAEFPVSATRDVLYGQNGATVEIELSGFAANTLTSFIFAASRLGVADMRTTDYVVRGFNSGIATLDPSNNTSQTANVVDILPDAEGRITISIKAALSNTNTGTHYFYLGALRIITVTTTGVSELLGFDQAELNVSLEQGAGSFDAMVTVNQSTGVTPPVSLSAVDTDTGLTPTWLNLPAGATIGAPVTITFDESTLALGDYSAVVTASAPSHPDASLAVNLTVRTPGGMNLLFYGNSYSQGNLGMPTLAGYIGEEAGHPAPNVVSQLVGGQNLLYHLTNPVQAAAITDALPLGEQWDFVIMQGFSLEATIQYGDPAAFRANALAILTNVRAHSPNAGAVMFQTWARGSGFSGYSGTYADPLEMHAEIRSNYQLAVADMNAAFGAGTAFNSAIGDAVALLAFDSSLYTSDQSHPTAPTSLMAAMGVYQALYRERVCDLQPDFGTAGNLVDRLAAMDLSAADWSAYSGIAERIADADLRRFAGSSEDLLVETGINGAQDACPKQGAASGDVIRAVLTSPNGLYAGMPSFIILDPFLTGNTPGTLDPWPELHFHLPSSFIVRQTPSLSANLTYEATIPDSFPGLSLLLQALTLAPSPTTGNPSFTTTDGHEFVLE